MSELKNSLWLAPVTKESARGFLARHPLGAGNSIYQFAIGVFWEGRLEGVMTWGIPGTNMGAYSLRLRAKEVLELRKFWMTDTPPRNSESRALGVAVRMIRKRYPHLKALIIYCEGDEKASAYKGCGWVVVHRSTHATTVTSLNGLTLSVREFNRRGGTKRLGSGWKENSVTKAKLVYPLDPSIAAVVQRQDARHPAGRRRFNSDPAACGSRKGDSNDDVVNVVKAGEAPDLDGVCEPSRIGDDETVRARRPRTHRRRRDGKTVDQIDDADKGTKGERCAVENVRGVSGEETTDRGVA